MSEPKMKQLSVALGTAGQLCLVAGYTGLIDYASLIVGGVVLGVTHFYTMEIDFKGVLQVRPYAYLPFPLSGMVLYKNLEQILGDFSGSLFGK